MSTLSESFVDLETTRGRLRVHQVSVMKAATPAKGSPPSSAPKTVSTAVEHSVLKTLVTAP